MNTLTINKRRTINQSIKKGIIYETGIHEGMGTTLVRAVLHAQPCVCACVVFPSSLSVLFSRLVRVCVCVCAMRSTVCPQGWSLRSGWSCNTAEKAGMWGSVNVYWGKAMCSLREGRGERGIPCWCRALKKERKPSWWRDAFACYHLSCFSLFFVFLPLLYFPTGEVRILASLRSFLPPFFSVLHVFLNLTDVSCFFSVCAACL